MEYQIGDFSKITRMSIKTLRYYHEYGLLSPSRIDTMSGYRYYDENAFERARVIGNLKELDFSLKQIKEILDQYTDDSEITNFIERKKNDLLKKIEHYRSIEKKLNMVLAIEKEAAMNNYSQDIIIKDIPQVLVATIRYKGRYDEFGKYAGKLFKQCTRYINGKPFSLYHDKDYKEEGADIEICVPVKQAVNKEDVTSRTLPAVNAITLIHKGPYETLGTSYKKIMDYVNNHNIELDTPTREHYIKGPGMILRGNPKKYITEIQVVPKNTKG